MADYNWSYEAIAIGTVGASTPLSKALSGNKTLYQVKIDAVQANDDATLKIYRNSTASGNRIFDGYMVNRDENGVINLPRGRYCATSAIVEVDGGSGDMIVSFRYD
jgi:hypothetical protein